MAKVILESWREKARSRNPEKKRIMKEVVNDKVKFVYYDLEGKLAIESVWASNEGLLLARFFYNKRFHIRNRFKSKDVTILSE